MGCAARKDFSAAFFFHEYGRRVGTVPRSSLKEGKNRQMVEKGTKAPKPTQTKHPSPQAETVARFTLSCRLLSLGIAAVFEFCLTASDWSCMRHRLNGLCCKYGLVHGCCLDLRTFGWPDYNHCWSIARHLTCKVTLFCHTVVRPLVTNTW